MSRDFLAALYPLDATAPYGELRVIRNGEVRQFWHDVENLHALMEAGLAADAAGWDAYIGVLPRIRQGGKAEDCKPTTTVLWADIDTKNLGGSHMASLLSVQKAGLEPSILVDSGNGLHAYWLLRQPVPFAKASAAMRGLHKLIGSDSVHDAPRVLRLPGTYNHKECEADLCLGKPVRLLAFDPNRRYRWMDVADFAEEPEPRRQMGSYDMRRAEYHELPDWLRDKIEKGAPQGQRSELIWGVVIGLLERGWEEDEIGALLAVMPAGEKMAEMNDRNAERYLQRTIERAREVIT